MRFYALLDRLVLQPSADHRWLLQRDADQREAARVCGAARPPVDAIPG
jgi:hypothetical protein